jgi:hypothetical protein
MSDMTEHKLSRVIPNETWGLVIEFDQGEHRLFNSRIAREEMGWSQLAYPNKLKNLTFTDSHVRWPTGEELTAGYLYRKSEPLSQAELERQVLRLSYKNQAPTAIHPTHHVYGVYLFPFSTRLFDVGESIAGGHAELGGSRSMTLEELLAWQDWKLHFTLSGGDWAMPLIELNAECSETLSDLLVREICRREGTLA